MTLLMVLIIVSCFLTLYRLAAGPTAPDRTTAIDILGILVVGFSGLMAVKTGRDMYLNIALSWAILSFVGTLAVAKYLEGKNFDE